jgi:hypothetical protein
MADRRNTLFARSPVPKPARWADRGGLSACPEQSEAFSPDVHALQRSLSDES